LKLVRFPKAADSWDVDQQLQVDDANEAGLSDPGSPANSSSQPEAETQNHRDYFEDVIRAAIERGGRYGGYEITMPWLNATLAGLEGRDAPLEEMQDSYQSADEAVHPVAEEPASATPGPPELIESGP